MKAGSPALLHDNRSWGVVSFLLLLGIAWFTFGRIFEIRPLDGDNLYILAWSDRVSAARLLWGDPIFYPEWRPLAFLTVWLQYQWWNVNHIAPYFAANLVIWTAAAWLVSHVVDRLANSRLAGLLAGALVLTDARAVKAMVWIVDRQMTLGCLFGLLAVVLVVRRGELRLSRPELLTVFLLLLSAALSKEYGLAFAAALGVYAVITSRPQIAAAAGFSAVVYLCLRFSVVTGSFGGYCEENGYFWTTRTICYGEAGPLPIHQMLYNVAATALGSVLHGLFSPHGMLVAMPRRLLGLAIKPVLATIGWLRGPQLTRLMVFVILANASLSFMLYRDRNHLVAVCALGIALGVGIAVADTKLRNWKPMLRAIAVTLLVSFVAIQSARTRSAVSAEVDSLLSGDPCIELDSPGWLEPAFAYRIKARYGMSNPDCSTPTARLASEPPR